MSEPYVDFKERRRREALAGEAVIYQYDELPLPEALCHQIGHILKRALGSDSSLLSGAYTWQRPKVTPSTLWAHIAINTAERLGLPSLHDSLSPTQAVLRFILEADFEDAMAVIEYAFYVINHYLPYDAMTETAKEDTAVTLSPQRAVERLNQRFQENGVGYKLMGDYFVRIDSELIHAEVVEPGLHLLQIAGFEGPEQEYLRAHEHLRHKRNAEAMNDALKAFESTMKAICDVQNWERDPGATAAGLIRLLRNNAFFAPYHADYTTKITSLLEAGVPTNRNKNSGHGVGPVSQPIDDRLAVYTLHLAAANIVFLVETHLAITPPPQKNDGANGRKRDASGRFTKVAETA